eukprot:Sdes_comp20401_c0_seq1m14386
MPTQNQPNLFGPVWKILRRFFITYEFSSAMRFPKNLSHRTRILPNLPNGPAHKLSKNSYFVRDFRRNIQPPLVIPNPAIDGILIEEAKKRIGSLPLPPTPGSPFPVHSSPNSSS